jgi:hypothetical protein
MDVAGDDRRRLKLRRLEEGAACAEGGDGPDILDELWLPSGLSG